MVWLRCSLSSGVKLRARSEMRLKPDRMAAVGISPAQAADVAPLFTDFTSANLGVPRNFALPYLYESVPDQFGFVANSQGLNFLDFGVGTFLRNLGASPVPNKAWIPLAPKFDGKMQVPTLRNVDMRPRPDFVKAYMHNGYFKSLKAVVHFYNTRDTLNRGKHLPAGLPGEGTRYWPPPEVPQNLDRTIGNLGLSDSEENAIVAFLAVSGRRARGRRRVPRLRRGCRRA